MEGRAHLLREVAASLQMDTDKIIKEPERLKFDAEKAAAAAQLMQAQQQMQQPEAPVAMDAAGNPAGGTDVNTMNGVV